MEPPLTEAVYLWTPMAGRAFAFMLCLWASQEHLASGLANLWPSPAQWLLHSSEALLPYLNDICVGPALVGLIVLRIFEEHLVHVCARILEQLVRVVENDQSNLAVAKDTQLIGFLHQAKLPFGERHLQKMRQASRELVSYFVAFVIPLSPALCATPKRHSNIIKNIQ